jgi:acyl-ACP thioesterase
MIDTNGHMNNNQYVMVALECLPEGFHVREVRTEYRNAAMQGEMMYLKTGRTDDSYVIKFDNVEGKAFAIVEFR